MLKQVLLVGALALGCAGADGEDGFQGPPGPQGRPGVDGEDGEPASSDIIAGTVLCQANDGVSFIDAYIWVLDAEADPNDNIGICRIAEGLFSMTGPFIGSQCGLVSPANGTFTIDVSTNPPTLSGGFTGTMSCIGG